MVAAFTSAVAQPSANIATALPTTSTPQDQLVLKRRVAIGRFSNATNYGRALLLPGEQDPLSDQAGDMLASRLVESNRFIVLERRDLDAVRREQTIGVGQTPIAADTILVGSVTQFGRKMEGKSGFLNSQARQVANATVEVRLVDARTGQAFFSTKGSGSATVEVSEVAGFGSQAAYDSSLNDKAISAAISDLMTNVIQQLQERPWSTDILEVSGQTVLISGGHGEGLRIGDQLNVAQRGLTMTSRQTGLPIELPSQRVATIQITGFFGDGEAEGSSARLVSGQIGSDLSKLIVTSGAQ